MDVSIEKLAEILQTGLNTNTQGLTFDIKANVKDRRVASRDNKRYEVGGQLIQGVLTYMSSDITPVAGIGQRYVTAILRLAVTKQNVELVSTALQNYIELAVGSQQQVGSYKVTINFQMPQTNQARIDQYGVDVPLEVACFFRIIENGVTFSDTSIAVDGTVIPILSVNLAVTRADDPATPVVSTTTKTDFKSQAISISVTLPYLNNPTIVSLFDDVYKAKLPNKTYQITYSDSLHSGANALTYRMKIKEMPMRAEPLLTNGLSITFVEG